MCEAGRNEQRQPYESQFDKWDFATTINFYCMKTEVEESMTSIYPIYTDDDSAPSMKLKEYIPEGFTENPVRRYVRQSEEHQEDSTAPNRLCGCPKISTFNQILAWLIEQSTKDSMSPLRTSVDCNRSTNDPVDNTATQFSFENLGLGKISQEQAEEMKRRSHLLKTLLIEQKSKGQDDRIIENYISGSNQTENLIANDIDASESPNLLNDNELRNIFDRANALTKFDQQEYQTKKEYDDQGVISNAGNDLEVYEQDNGRQIEVANTKSDIYQENHLGHIDTKMNDPMRIVHEGNDRKTHMPSIINDMIKDFLENEQVGPTAIANAKKEKVHMVHEADEQNHAIQEDFSKMETVQGVHEQEHVEEIFIANAMNGHMHVDQEEGHPMQRAYHETKIFDQDDFRESAMACEVNNIVNQENPYGQMGIQEFNEKYNDRQSAIKTASIREMNIGHEEGLVVPDPYAKLGITPNFNEHVRMRQTAITNNPYGHLNAVHHVPGEAPFGQYPHMIGPRCPMESVPECFEHGEVRYMPRGHDPYSQMNIHPQRGNWSPLRDYAYAQPLQYLQPHPGSHHLILQEHHIVNHFAPPSSMACPPFPFRQVRQHGNWNINRPYHPFHGPIPINFTAVPHPGNQPIQFLPNNTRETHRNIIPSLFNSNKNMVRNVKTNDDNDRQEVMKNIPETSSIPIIQHAITSLKSVRHDNMIEEIKLSDPTKSDPSAQQKKYFSDETKKSSHSSSDVDIKVITTEQQKLRTNIPEPSNMQATKELETSVKTVENRKINKNSNMNCSFKSYILSMLSNKLKNNSKRIDSSQSDKNNDLNTTDRKTIITDRTVEGDDMIQDTKSDEKTETDYSNNPNQSFRKESEKHNRSSSDRNDKKNIIELDETNMKNPETSVKTIENKKSSSEFKDSINSYSSAPLNESFRKESEKPDRSSSDRDDKKIIIELDELETNMSKTNEKNRRTSVETIKIKTSISEFDDSVNSDSSTLLNESFTKESEKPDRSSSNQNNKKNIIEMDELKTKISKTNKEIPRTSVKTVKNKKSISEFNCLVKSDSSTPLNESFRKESEKRDRSSSNRNDKENIIETDELETHISKTIEKIRRTSVGTIKNETSISDLVNSDSSTPLNESFREESGKLDRSSSNQNDKKNIIELVQLKTNMSKTNEEVLRTSVKTVKNDKSICKSNDSVKSDSSTPLNESFRKESEKPDRSSSNRNNTRNIIELDELETSISKTNTENLETSIKTVENKKSISEFNDSVKSDSSTPLNESFREESEKPDRPSSDRNDKKIFNELEESETNMSKTTTKNPEVTVQTIQNKKLISELNYSVKSDSSTSLNESFRKELKNSEPILEDKIMEVRKVVNNIPESGYIKTTKSTEIIVKFAGSKKVNESNFQGNIIDPNEVMRNMPETDSSQILKSLERFVKSIGNEKKNIIELVDSATNMSKTSTRYPDTYVKTVNNKKSISDSVKSYSSGPLNESFGNEFKKSYPSIKNVGGNIIEQKEVMTNMSETNSSQILKSLERFVNTFGNDELPTISTLKDSAKSNSLASLNESFRKLSKKYDRLHLNPNDKRNIQVQKVVTNIPEIANSQTTKLAETYIEILEGDTSINIIQLNDSTKSNSSANFNESFRKDSKTSECFCTDHNVKGNIIELQEVIKTLPKNENAPPEISLIPFDCDETIAEELNDSTKTYTPAIRNEYFRKDSISSRGNIHPYTVEQQQMMIKFPEITDAKLTMNPETFVNTLDSAETMQYEESKKMIDFTTNQNQIFRYAPVFSSQNIIINNLMQQNIPKNVTETTNLMKLTIPELSTKTKLAPETESDYPMDQIESIKNYTKINRQKPSIRNVFHLLSNSTDKSEFLKQQNEFSRKKPENSFPNPNINTNMIKQEESLGIIFKNIHLQTTTIPNTSLNTSKGEELLTKLTEKLDTLVMHESIETTENEVSAPNAFLMRNDDVSSNRARVRGTLKEDLSGITTEKNTLQTENSISSQYQNSSTELSENTTSSSTETEEKDEESSPTEWRKIAYKKLKKIVHSTDLRFNYSAYVPPSSRKPSTQSSTTSNETEEEEIHIEHGNSTRGHRTNLYSNGRQKNKRKDKKSKKRSRRRR